MGLGHGGGGLIHTGLWCSPIWYGALYDLGSGMVIVCILAVLTRDHCGIHTQACCGGDAPGCSARTFSVVVFSRDCKNFFF